MAKTCVLFLFPERHKSSEPESRLKAMLCTQVPWIIQTSAALARKPWRCPNPVLHRHDWRQEWAAILHPCTVVSLSQWRMQKCSSTKLEAEAMGGNSTGLGVRRPGLPLLTCPKLAARPCPHPMFPLLVRPWILGRISDPSDLFWLYYSEVSLKRGSKCFHSVAKYTHPTELEAIFKYWPNEWMGGTLWDLGNFSRHSLGGLGPQLGLCNQWFYL